MVRKNKVIGYTLALIATFLWGLHPIGIRFLIGQDIEPMNIALSRIWMSVIILFIATFFMKRETEKFKYSQIFWIGVVGLTMTFIFFHKSLAFTFASHVMLIEAFSPVFVLILGLFLLPHQFKMLVRTKKLSHLFLIVATGSIGSSLLLLNPTDIIPQDTQRMGDLLIAIGSIFFAIFLLSSSELRKTVKTSSIGIMLRMFLGVGILLLPFINISNFTTFSTDQWIILTLIAIFGTAIPYILWNYASYYLEVTPLAMIFNLTVIFGVIAESILLNFPISTAFVASAALIIYAAAKADQINSKYI